MPERLIGAVLKTVERASVPWVRIPPPPNLKATLIGGFSSGVFRHSNCVGGESINSFRWILSSGLVITGGAIILGVIGIISAFEGLEVIKPFVIQNGQSGQKLV